ncbi:hypothetical protein HGRIS_014234 [Hohenbuehelia grisea]|uniref:Enhancer of polycomb-like protein n=1 Tax=Hohenbuehelia grisea TaxID=104357 RepID=A0ABR3JUU8_9AGAR
MPRNHNPGTSSLRNRNRITNKTRLKIHHGPIDADPLIMDEETFVSNSIQTAGVDAEETNEHHLQAVLSAASKRHQSARPARGDRPPSPKPAYIPVPQANGIADNYEELYPTGRWKDPATYIATSTTVEECISGALANGFTYYMDERDQEWLEKNNEEARGEGTSVQGAVSAANSTRTSARSAKAKGKEPESTQPVAITEDLFELVMGLFEKATHEKTEFLHHSLGAGMAFPAFTEYQDIFSLPIPSSTFASFSVPEWIPSSPNLFRIARTIYPYWKERRIERGGQRIIPPLNGDEADTLNESYVCFRRREIKAVRKTRASQASSSDKLARLQAELAQPLELAKLVLQREAVKKETLQHSQGVWGKRMAFADLKRKFPSLGDKADDELLYDREKEKKKAKVESTPRLRPKDAASPAAAAEAAVLPSARSAQLQSQIEREVQRQKDRDHHWEDSVDNVYQALPVPLPSRAFKFISSTESTPPEERLARQPRALRLRYGRGGRVLVDRRQGPPPSRIRRDGARQALSLTSRRHSSFDEEDSSNEDTEWEQRLLARWRFDQDDYPHVGPHGSDEQDRVLVDDFNPSFMRHNITLLSDSDMQNLATDATLTLTNAEGRQQQVTPFRLGPPVFSRLPPARLMPSVPPVGVVPAATPGPVPSATPVSAPAAVKKIPQPPAAVPQMRISSNGGIRSPSTAGPTAAPSTNTSTGANPDRERCQRSEPWRHQYASPRRGEIRD